MRCGFAACVGGPVIFTLYGIGVACIEFHQRWRLTAKRRGAVARVAWSPCWGSHGCTRASREPAWLNQSCAADTASNWVAGSRCLSRQQVGRFVRGRTRVSRWPAGLQPRGPCRLSHACIAGTPGRLHITCRSTRTHKCVRSLRSHLALCAGYLHVRRQWISRTHPIALPLSQVCGVASGCHLRSHGLLQPDCRLDLVKTRSLC